MKTISFLLPAALMAAASAAHAVDIPFTGLGSAGVDPIGHAWNLTPSLDAGQDPSWGEPGQAGGTERFNINDVSNSHGDYATGFLFVVRGGLDGAIGQDPSTRFKDFTTGDVWTPHFLGTHGVLFTAPGVDRVSRFDEFIVNVGLLGALNFEQFAFTARWLDGGSPGEIGPPGVPEPAAWALMIAGFGLVGATLRRRAAAQTA
jgi:hypothetical protein